MKLRFNKENTKAFYGCSRYPECDGTVNADMDGTPKGIPADKETKVLRRKISEALNTWYNFDDNTERREALDFLKRKTGTWKISELNKNQCMELLGEMNKL